ncbi:MAG: acyl-CoA dehydrogenase family protein [Actinomycetota bacterium]
MDFSVPAELADLRASFRAFLDREVRPVDERFRVEIQEDVATGEMRDAATALRRKSCEQGFYAAYFPEEEGGWGLSKLGMAMLVEDNYASGLRFAQYVIGPPNPEAPTTLLLECTPEQKARYLTPLMRGETSMCFALTEPEAGSDAQAIRMRAERDGDFWVLNGVKHYITNGAHADFAIVFAVNDSAKRASGGITAFIVEAGTPGFKVGKHQKTLAGDTNQSELIFEDCRVPAANVIGQEGYGFYSAMKFLNAGRAFIGAMCVGTAEYLIRTAAEYAKVRTAFGRPIGKYQAIQWMLADSTVEVEAARLLAYQLAWKVDQGLDSLALARDSSIVKLNNTEMVNRVADRAVQIFGGMGVLTEGPVEYAYRVSRMLRIVEGTSEIQRLIIARSLGL